MRLRRAGDGRPSSGGVAPVQRACDCAPAVPDRAAGGQYARQRQLLLHVQRSHWTCHQLSLHCQLGPERLCGRPRQRPASIWRHHHGP